MTGAAEGAEVTEQALVKSPFMREAFGAGKRDLLDRSVSDADFEQTWKMTRAEMRAAISDYESRCAGWELIWMLDGQIPQSTQVITPIGYKKKPIPAKLRWAVFKRDGYRCVTCGADEDLAADHIHSEARGGETTLNNLQTLCRRCNGRKGAN